MNDKRTINQNNGGIKMTRFNPIGKEIEKSQKNLLGAMVETGTYFTVRFEPLQLPDGTLVDFKTAVVRNDNDRPIAVVNPTYEVIQHQTAFEIADVLVREFGGRYYFGGTLRGGAIGYMAVDLGEIFPDDPLRKTFLVTNSHDGSCALTGKILSYRVACWNAVMGARGQLAVRIHHTRNADEKIEMAKQIVATADEYFDGEIKVYTKLLGVKVSTQQAQKYLKKLFGYDKKTERGQKIVERRIDEIMAVFGSSPAIVDTPADKTLWGLFNAVTEYEQHHRNRRENSAWQEQYILHTGAVESLHKRALELALEFAN